MSEYRRVEESYRGSASARRAGLPAGPGLGSRNTRGLEVVFFHKNFRDPANYYVKMYSIDFFLERL